MEISSIVTRICLERALAAIASTLAVAASAADYRQEADQLAREIVEIHPRGAEIAALPEFKSAREALLEIAGDTDLAHYAVTLGRN